MGHTKFLLLAIICVLVSGSCEKDNANTTEGVTFTELTDDDAISITLGNNIVDYSEIIGYDSCKHIFSLTEDAGERIRAQDYPVTPTQFAVVVDGELIYIANFIPGYSSVSCFECICVEPYSYSNKYVVNLGYPTSSSFSGSDPRNDERIISRLEKDKKLIEIDL